MSPERPLPGQTLLDDYSGLKFKSVKTRAQLNEVEFSNNAEAIAKYLSRKPTKRMAPFTRAWMLRLHKQMFGRVWAWAGKPRTTSGLTFGVKAHMVPMALEELAQSVVCWRVGDWDLIEQAAALHHRAVKIHPFLDGNGRWARLLANIWTKQNDGPLVAWPQSELREGASTLRETYLAAIKQADGGDVSFLLQLHRQYSEGAGN